MYSFASLLQPLLFLVAVLASSSSSSFQIQHGTNGLYWEEEAPSIISQTDDDNEKYYDRHDGDRQQRGRPILLWRPLKFQHAQFERKNLQKSSHPLRTNVWRIRLSWRNRYYIPDNTFIVEFDPRGYCKVTDEHITEASSISHNSTQKDPIYRGCVGKWNMIPAGVLWNFSSLQFWAELHLQPFADHPRMLRGIIVRERSDQSIIPKHWFRPVVGTFEAVGIGEDFKDYSYADRGFALDSTHTFLK